MSSHRIRYLLADEVGLGKTIEAGLIMRELKLRGMARISACHWRTSPLGVTTRTLRAIPHHTGKATGAAE